MSGRGHFHTNPTPPQLQSQMCKISIARHENDDLGTHLYGKLDRIDRHQDVDVGFVMLAITRRAIFCHYEESVGAKPMQELVLILSFGLPLRVLEVVSPA